MILVKISNNIVVNPNLISCVEQVESRGVTKIIVWVEGRKYDLEVPLQEFMDELSQTAAVGQQQYWAG